MATIVFVHAHPDDEASSTGGSMARAAAEGHRVVLVVCTDGAQGESPADLADGETLVARRRAETAASAAALGIDEVVWLGYGDSGMTGWPQNDDPGSFWQADLDAAGERLAAILRAQRAEVVVLYDWHGIYGHPDHIQVHRVGHRAADLAGTPQRFEISFNRDLMARLAAAEPDRDRAQELDPSGPADDGNPFGTPESELNVAVDVVDYLDQKRAALTAHRSQVTDIGMMLAMPSDTFAALFGTEWYIEPGTPPGVYREWLLEEV